MSGTSFRLTGFYHMAFLPAKGGLIDQQNLVMQTLYAIKTEYTNIYEHHLKA